MFEQWSLWDLEIVLNFLMVAALPLSAAYFPMVYLCWSVHLWYCDDRPEDFSEAVNSSINCASTLPISDVLVDSSSIKCNKTENCRAYQCHNVNVNDNTYSLHILLHFEKVISSKSSQLYGLTKYLKCRIILNGKNITYPLSLPHWYFEFIQFVYF